MDVKLTYRGRVVTGADVAFIDKLISEHPTASRRALSKKLCEAWNWVQPNGTPRDMVCRGLMLELHRAGHIVLPKQRWVIAYNTRFLILPWVEVPHLASHILGRIARVLPQDWKRIYGHSVYFLETFIDPQRFRGTCYRAANWIVLGRTTGRGKDDQTMKPNRPIKEVLGYPLSKRFRELLCHIA